MRHQRSGIIVTALLLTGMAIWGVSTHAEAGAPSVAAKVASNIRLLLNGTPWEPQDGQGQPLYPIEINGTTYLPVRAIAEGLQAEIEWNGAAQTISIRNRQDTASDTKSAGPSTSLPSTDLPSTSLPSESAAAESPDLKHLPIGDGKITYTAPDQGYVFLTRVNFRQNGSPSGSWIHSDGTYDATAKPTVSGEVHWDSQFQVKVVGDKRVITGNALPDHTTGRYPIAPGDAAYTYDHNPNDIEAHPYTITLPANPEASSRPSPTSMGPIGIMMTDVVLFNALDDAGNDAAAHEIQDGCDGHPQKDGVYHYHNLSACIPLTAKANSSQLIGYALDGFGIYAEYGPDGDLVTNGDLDANHGRTSRVEWDGTWKTMYHYDVTHEFPYTIGAFAGTPVQVQFQSNR